jgi:hypothetical protein
VVGDLPRLAAVGRHDVELRFAVLDLPDEREEPAVG